MDFFPEICMKAQNARHTHTFPHFSKQEAAVTEEYGIPANTLDPSISWKDVYWLQSITRLPIIIKGILTKEDAELAVEHGVQGIIVSNHGGRQLDGGPASVATESIVNYGCAGHSQLYPLPFFTLQIDALSEIVDTVQGRIEVYLDGGIRTGSDVLKSLALGAKCVFIGRPAVWGLAYKVEHPSRLCQCWDPDETCRVIVLSLRFPSWYQPTFLVTTLFVKGFIPAGSVEYMSSGF